MILSNSLFHIVAAATFFALIFAILYYNQKIEYCRKFILNSSSSTIRSPAGSLFKALSFWYRFEFEEKPRQFFQVPLIIAISRKSNFWDWLNSGKVKSVELVNISTNQSWKLVIRLRDVSHLDSDTMKVLGAQNPKLLVDVISG